MPLVFLLPKIWLCVFFIFLLQYYIFAYVDAPGYQILKNLNIISTGVLYRIILKKKWVLTIIDDGSFTLSWKIFAKSPLEIKWRQDSHNNSFGLHVTSLILLKIFTIKNVGMSRKGNKKKSILCFLFLCLPFQFKPILGMWKRPWA